MPRELWYKEAVIYCLDVETFQDTNHDGIGDFHGARERLDYIVALGINVLWLLPFYPTPNRDNGYDVLDYYGIDSRLGTAGDFVEFMHAARERGLRVIIDLPVNHTSIEHPWFQAARSDPESPYHDFYVWSDDRPDDADEGMVFPGVEDTVWTYDRKAKKYYHHRFYSHQPDLNISNPEVRKEIMRIMGYWLELGVSGFRLDAAPFLIEMKGVDCAADQDPYQYLQDFRSFLSWRRGDAILLAEANVEPEKVQDYFGEGTKMHMLFNFMLNQHLFLALARQRRDPLVEGFTITPPIPDDGQWAQFLRNHDELDLGRLTAVQRRAVFDAFAPEESMRLYDRGIRRRLAPMLGGDEARIRMARSLVLTLPGTPVLRYGEEIGMGDDLSLEERDAVRTAMQWNDGKNAGFSTADPQDLPRPVIWGGDYGAETVNVEAQERDPDSLLNWTERAIRTRKECPEIGQGDGTLIEASDPAVFAHMCSTAKHTFIAAHNLCEQPVTVRLDTSAVEGEELIELLDGRERRPLEDETELELEGYGFVWLRVAEPVTGRR
jgi:maltose alpha-D-glucosyltransferase / alpha-amylase